MNEMEQMLLATRRLLSVLCDSCEQLTHEWEVIEPSPSLLELLGIEKKCSTLPFLQFISLEDQERFATFGANGTDTPSSLHVRMQTGQGSLKSFMIDMLFLFVGSYFTYYYIWLLFLLLLLLL